MHKYTRKASIQLTSWKIIEEYHIDPNIVFDRAGLDKKDMYRDEGRYSANQIAALWREMERVIPDPCFGLKAGECWHPSYMGTLGFSLLMSHTLREVFERYARYSTIISPLNKIDIVEDQEKQTLSFLYPVDYQDLRSSARESALLAWGVSILRTNFPKKLIPVSVNFTHETPECNARYFETFQTTITFDNERPSIEIALQDADTPLPGASSELIEKSDQILANYLSQQKAKTASLATRTMGAIIEHLAAGTATIEVVAAQFGMSGKTLQRRLKDENTKFSELMNRTRVDLANNYLRNRNKDIAEIAYLLGYSEQSSFSRSFKTMTGTSPSEYREQFFNH